jgi:hypothetical protein
MNLACISHVVAHVPFNSGVFKVKPFLFTVILVVLFCRCHCIFFLVTFYAPTLHNHKLFLVYGKQAPGPSHSNGETFHQEAGRGWTASKITEVDMKKAKKDGFLAQSAEIVFPGDEIIPRPIDGFRVMFISFLLRGLSLPAHEFLCGLQFVYGVQLHQLTPNSILHIACFIMLCEAFLGMILIGDYGSTSSISIAMCPRRKSMT